MEEKSEKTNWVDIPPGKYVQRDLEDQIREEQEARQVNNSTNTQTMTTITTSGVLADLKSGYTRFKKDDKGHGSIEEKYGLTVDEVKELFQTPSLKAKKTALPKRKLEIIDDLSKPVVSASPQGEVITLGELTPGSVGIFDLPAMAEPADLEARSVLPDVPQEATKDQPADASITKENIFA